ncbi:MAG: DinB family protein [Phycisphaerae bacterium]|nr:DinB family protein [Phycisphaerae bacterium]
MTTTLDSPVAMQAVPHLAQDPVAPLIGMLRQLDKLLAATSNGQYVQKPVGVVPSSLGGHIRHCLDHVEALLVGTDTGEINYDHRERGTAVETDRLAARVVIRDLEERLASLDRRIIGRSVLVTAMVSGDRTYLRATSTVGRELLFVLSHTIHHDALLAAMCRTLGIPIPDRFGYAPATIAHLEEAECAPSASFG